jgi:hypothetical protein
VKPVVITVVGAAEMLAEITAGLVAVQEQTQVAQVHRAQDQAVAILVEITAGLVEVQVQTQVAQANPAQVPTAAITDHSKENQAKATRPMPVLDYLEAQKVKHPVVDMAAVLGLTQVAQEHPEQVQDPVQDPVQNQVVSILVM